MKKNIWYYKITFIHLYQTITPMAIKSIKEFKKEKIEIDLTGPEGNAIYLLGLAVSLGKKLGKSEVELKEIQEDMMCGDYEHLLWVFNKHYGDYVDLYR